MFTEIISQMNATEITRQLTDAVNPRRIGEPSLFIDDVRNDSDRTGLAGERTVCWTAIDHR